MANIHTSLYQSPRSLLTAVYFSATTNQQPKHLQRYPKSTTTRMFNLTRRGEAPGSLTPGTYKLLVALLVIFVFGLLICSALFFFRQRRNARLALALPLYSDKRSSTSSNSSHHHRRSRARPSHSIHIYHDQRELDEKLSRPSSPGGSVPEIRITFPEEYDGEGKRQSGRVVVVHVGDSGVGMSPVAEKGAVSSTV